MRNPPTSSYDIVSGTFDLSIDGSTVTVKGDISSTYNTALIPINVSFDVGNNPMDYSLRELGKMAIVQHFQKNES